MTQAQATAATVPIRKELRLLNPIDGEVVYVVGENCEAIDRQQNGYVIHKGAGMLFVGDNRVDHFKQNPRPGYEQEQRDAASGENPSFAEKLADGSWRCECGVEKKTLHAVKIHHGKAHGGGR